MVPAWGCSRGDDHVPGAHLGVLESFGDVLDGAAWDVVVFEAVDEGC